MLTDQTDKALTFLPGPVVVGAGMMPYQTALLRAMESQMGFPHVFVEKRPSSVTSYNVGLDMARLERDVETPLETFSRLIERQMQRMTLEMISAMQGSRARKVGDVWLDEVALWVPSRQREAGLTYDDLRRLWVRSEDAKPRLRRVRLSSALVEFYRRPRSKKRRIVKKWRKRSENYRPHPLVFQERYFLGRHAALNGYGMVSSPVEGRRVVNDREVMLLAHPVTWVRMCERCPELRDVEVMR